MTDVCVAQRPAAGSDGRALGLHAEHAAVFSGGEPPDRAGAATVY